MLDGQQLATRAAVGAAAGTVLHAVEIVGVSPCKCLGLGSHAGTRSLPRCLCPRLVRLPNPTLEVQPSRGGARGHQWRLGVTDRRGVGLGDARLGLRRPLVAPPLDLRLRQRLGGDESTLPDARLRGVEAVLAPALQGPSARAAVAEVGVHLGASGHVPRQQIGLVHPQGQATPPHAGAEGAEVKGVLAARLVGQQQPDNLAALEEDGRAALSIFPHAASLRRRLDQVDH